METREIEQEQQRQEVVTPPPFRPSEETQEGKEAVPVNALASKLEALGLDDATTNRLTELTTGLEAEALSPELLDTLARGVTRDDDVKNADAAGYLRGRNEKIEAVLHQQPHDEEEASPTPVFPRYCRRSIWD